MKYRWAHYIFTTVYRWNCLHLTYSVTVFSLWIFVTIYVPVSQIFSRCTTSISVLLDYAVEGFAITCWQCVKRSKKEVASAVCTSENKGAVGTEGWGVGTGEGWGVILKSAGPGPPRLRPACWHWHKNKTDTVLLLLKTQSRCRPTVFLSWNEHNNVIVIIVPFTVSIAPLMRLRFTM